jgi:hypothetical protein
VIVLDANVLVYAYDSTSDRHAGVRAWLERILNGDEAVGLPLVSALAFIRIVTNPAVMDQPMPPVDAVEVIASIVSRRAVTVLEPTERHWEVLAQLVATGKAKGPLVMDAHIAALALERGGRVATTDRDFVRFDIGTIDPSTT